jgi:NADPH-dependent 2,4-dienoyl-CoA reductase/sulfur reductase-like enzyme
MSEDRGRRGPARPAAAPRCAARGRGAGFIGQEVAATARARGVEVTLIEAAPAPLHALLGSALGGWFARLHRDAGVDVRLGTRIERYRGRAGRCGPSRSPTAPRSRATRCCAGSASAPTRAGSRAPGLPRTACPSTGRAHRGVPGVFAAGDVALGHHWEAAVAQGSRGRPRACSAWRPPPQPRTSFWSDLGGTRVQLAGDPRGADAVQLDGDPDARDFTALFVRDGIVRAGLLVGRPRALPALRDRLDQAVPDGRTA